LVGTISEGVHPFVLVRSANTDKVLLGSNLPYSPRGALRTSLSHFFEERLMNGTPYPNNFQLEYPRERRSLLTSALVALAAQRLPLPAWTRRAEAARPTWRHGVSAFGDLKYPAGFKQCPVGTAGQIGRKRT
jgi:hypothetical protein